MAKWSTAEVPAREVPAGIPARGSGEVSRPPVEGRPGTGAQGHHPARGGDAPGGYGPEDFPGCESFPLSERALEDYEGRLEFWDGLSETAWKVREPPSFHHEGPSQRLVEMATRVASLRGSPIACFGSAGLVRRDAAGRKRWLMQADQVLFLHPERVRWRRALGRGHRPLARRGAGGGPQHGCAPSQAGDLHGERLSGDLGGGAVGELAARAGAGDPRAPGRNVPGGGGEPGPFRGGRGRTSSGC